MARMLNNKGVGLIGLVMGLAILLVCFYLVYTFYLKPSVSAPASSPGGSGAVVPLGKIVGTAKKQLEAVKEQHASGGIE